MVATLNKGYCIVLNIQLQNVHVKYKFILISLWLFLAVFLQKNVFTIVRLK